MRLEELAIDEKIYIQMMWGGKAIEFPSAVVAKNGETAYASPYMHNGQVLELNIDYSSGVVVKVFATNPLNKQRISWKNVEISTEVYDGETVYAIRTGAYNHIATEDDRRQNNRIVVHKPAKAYDPVSDNSTDVIVHDISDVGISFYAPHSFKPGSPQLEISFTDYVDGRGFDIKVVCSIVRTQDKAGNLFDGCRIEDHNKDYTLYGFMLRLKEKNRLKPSLE